MWRIRFDGMRVALYDKERVTIYLVNCRDAINEPPVRAFSNLAAAEEWAARENGLRRIEERGTRENPYYVEEFDLFDSAAAAGSDELVPDSTLPA